MAVPIFSFAGRKRLALNMKRRWVKGWKGGEEEVGEAGAAEADAKTPSWIARLAMHSLPLQLDRRHRRLGPRRVPHNPAEDEPTLGRFYDVTLHFLRIPFRAS